MAKPDLDDGYLRIAHELFAAIVCAGFNKWEMVVLREVFDQVYGPRKLKTAMLSPSEIAGRYGTFKESVYRATRALAESGVIARDGDGSYRFVKDYGRWTAAGKPRISPVEAACCEASRRIKPSNSSVNNGAHAVNNGAHASTEAVNDGAHEREQRRSRPVSAGAHAPIEDPARQKNLEKKNSGAAACDDPPYPDPDRSPLMIMGGSCPMAEADARSIWSMLWRQWGSMKVCAGFYEHQEWFPAEAWREAIREVVRRDQRPETIRLIEIIAGDGGRRGSRRRNESAPVPYKEPRIPIHRKGDPL